MLSEEMIIRLLKEILTRLGGDSSTYIPMPKKRTMPFNGHTTAFLALILGILLGVFIAMGIIGVKA